MINPSGKDTEAFEVAPLRSLDDFLLETARFQMPNLKDWDKWGNRVVNNLIYYQSNYILMAITLFSLVTFLHPFKMFLGFLAIGLAFGLLSIASNGPSAMKFKREHPVVGIVLTVLGALSVLYLLDGVVIFMLGILLPISAIFIHASLRLRNLRNKLANKMEQLGLKKSTPMGMLLDALGIEASVVE